MKRIAMIWIALGALVLVTPARADEKPREYKPGEPFPCCERHCRPKLTCHVEHKIDKVKKSCWKVKCKEICIPAVTFPWSRKRDCWAPPHGRVRIVHVLEKKSYECDKEVCKWNLEPKCERGCGSIPIHGEPLPIPGPRK